MSPIARPARRPICSSGTTRGKTSSLASVGSLAAAWIQPQRVGDQQADRLDLVDAALAAAHADRPLDGAERHQRHQQVERSAVAAQHAEARLRRGVEAARHREVDLQPGDRDRAATLDAHDQVDLVVREGAVVARTRGCSGRSGAPASDQSRVDAGQRQHQRCHRRERRRLVPDGDGQQQRGQGDATRRDQPERVAGRVAVVAGSLDRHGRRRRRPRPGRSARSARAAVPGSSAAAGGRGPARPAPSRRPAPRRSGP